MNTTQDDGGPAFPNMGEIFIDGPQGRHPQSAWGMDGNKGMSLRDWLAGMALCGLMQNGQFAPSQIGESAVSFADATLAALKGKEAR